LWNAAILEELVRHETRKLVKRGLASSEAEAVAERLILKMREGFDDALVLGWEPLEGSFGLPDPTDEHVVAAAVVGGAGVIVTDNIRHFPITHVPEHIRVLRAKDFAADTIDLNPLRAAGALREFGGAIGALAIPRKSS
jgi:hypothetical protein